jgi:hypothetical protein
MKAHLNTLILAAAILLTALIFSNAFVNRNKASKTISVTGLGRKDFVSDLIVWNGSFTQKNLSLKEAYASLDKDRESIRRYLLSKGLTSENIIFSAVEINKLFDEVYDANGRKTKSVFEGYSLKQNVQIESNEVDKIENLSRQVSRGDQRCLYPCTKNCTACRWKGGLT